MKRISKNYFKIFILFFISIFIFIKILIYNKIPDNILAENEKEIILRNILPLTDVKIKPKTNFFNTTKNKDTNIKSNSDLKTINLVANTKSSTTNSTKSNNNIKTLKNFRNDIKNNTNVGFKANASVFNIPVKNVNVKVVERKEVIPCGIPVGIKITPNGLMVLKTTFFETSSGEVNPSFDCGLKFADIITKVNDVPITYENFETYIKNSNGGSVKLTILRNQLNLELNLVPKFSISSKKYEAGIYLRDPYVGVGMLSFIDPTTLEFIALGHPLKDETTNKILPLMDGQILFANINSVKKSTKNSPGELKSSIILQNIIGNIRINNEFGIFGKINNLFLDKIISKKLNGTEEKTLPIAFKHEIEKGPALLLTTTSNNVPKYFDINVKNIKSLNQNKEDKKDIYFEVTDKQLIDQTGGITKGMSGSPLIQNNKIIGILNFVVVSNPATAYAQAISNIIY